MATSCFSMYFVILWNSSEVNQHKMLRSEQGDDWAYVLMMYYHCITFTVLSRSECRALVLKNNKILRDPTIFHLLTYLDISTKSTPVPNLIHNYSSFMSCTVYFEPGPCLWSILVFGCRLIQGHPRSRSLVQVQYTIWKNYAMQKANKI